MTDIDLYINFVLHAIVGRLAEADVIMGLKPGAIERVASFLAFKYPFEEKPIYRGVLLDPVKPYRHETGRKFMSWSEDHDVAAWFASTGSLISEPLAESNDKLRGFMFSLLSPPQSRVLFHYSWTKLFESPTLDMLALQHPFMGLEGQRQIAWSLRTQREVITQPINGLVPKRFETPNVIELDRKLSPPWILSEMPS